MSKMGWFWVARGHSKSCRCQSLGWFHWNFDEIFGAKKTRVPGHPMAVFAWSLI